MNILLDGCPKEVEINGNVYPISSDFRTSILFDMAMSDPELDESMKVLQTLKLYYKGASIMNEDIADAFNAALSFYRLGEDIELNRNKSEDSQDNNKGSRLFSFDYDANYIFTSFLTAYNIDLNEIDYLHWWKFKVMMDNLPEDTIMKKIIGIRATNLSSNMSKEERKRIMKLKKIYKLPESEEKRNEDFNNSLSNMF